MTQKPSLAGIVANVLEKQRLTQIIRPLCGNCAHPFPVLTS